jgi:hypothetical protein
MGRQGSSPSERRVLEGSGALLLKTLSEGIASQPAFGAFAAGYGVLALLRPIIGVGATGAEAAALAVHWQLDRKMREAFELLGIPGMEAFQVTEIMKAVLARTCPVSTAVYGKTFSAEALVVENYDTEDFRRLLGVNLFDDVTWFNKEAFGEVISYAPLFLVLESGEAFKEAPASKPGKTAAKTTKAAAKPLADPAMASEAWIARVENIAVLTEKFRRAETESGYRLDKLLEALSESGSKAGKARKGTAKKAAGGKKK